MKQIHIRLHANTAGYRFLFFLLCLPYIMQAQQKQSWIPIQISRESVTSQHGWSPLRYATWQLDMQHMINDLSAAPDFTSANARPVRIVLPLPDGSLEKIDLFEMSVMEAALQEKYPGFRTFSGHCVDHPAWSVKCDYTELGFHAILFTEHGTVYIDPLSLTNKQDYLVFYKHESGQSPHMVCEVDESLFAEPFHHGELPPGMAKSTGGQLRTYRLAVAATGEYVAFFGGTVSAGMSAIVTSVNRVNGVYEKEVDVRLVLVANNNLLVYTNASTDPYTNGSGSTMLGENQANITNVIGSANYDIGHVFSTGGGGIAGLGVVCSSSNKARGVTGSSSPVGDPFDIDYVAHEMGHQFAGNHTFNSATGSCSGNRAASAAYEPGSGITIQAYAGICGTDNLAPNSIDVFHTKSFDEIYDFTTTGGGNTCPVTTSSGNAAPILDSLTGEKFIPYNTAFKLKAYGHDPNLDPVLYSWEQYDLGAAGAWNAPTGTAPMFTSILPQSSGERIFPKLANILNNTISPGEIYPTYARNMNFRVTLRDNKTGGGGVMHNDALVLIHVVNVGDTFKVTYPNAAGISFTQNTCPTVRWKVAGTTASPVSAALVNILLSVDGGLTFPFTLVSNTANDGSEVVTLPAGVTTTTARIMIESVGNIFFDINDNNFTITNSMVVAGLAFPNTSCSGSPTGSVDIAGSCTLPAFSYAWSNGATTQDLTGVGAGTYTVTVTNSVGATASGVFTVGLATALSVGITASSSPATCNAAADGSASASNIGGIAPYNYTWSNGQSGSIATALLPAAYTVTVTDGNNCTASTAVSVTSSTAVPVPVTTAYSLCEGAAVSVGQGLSASTSVLGPFTKVNRFTGSPFTSNGPLTTVSTITLPALPTGAIISSAQLKLYNVVAQGTSLRNEIRVSLSGAYSLAATQLSTLASAGAVSPDPVITLPSFPVNGGSISLQFSETLDNTGVDATIDSARIEITFTLPTTVSWWSVPSSGTQQGSGSPFNPVGTTTLPNTNVPGSYTFYAQGQAGACSSVSRATAVFTVLPAPSPVITGNLSFCPGASTSLATSTAYSAYVWSNGATTPGITVNTAATFSVTVTAANGCTKTSAPVTTSLNTLPSVTCAPNTNAWLASGCQAAVNYPVTSSGIPGPSITYTFSGASTGSGSGSGSGSFFEKGNTSVTINASNVCGSSSCTFQVAVIDTIKPQVICPLNIITCNPLVTYSASVSDNCSNTILSASHPSGSVFPVGITTVTLTATDASANTSSCSFTVEVLPPIQVSGTVNACSSYTWVQNGNAVYTVSGVYTATFVASNGCDSIHQLHLTIPQGIVLSVKAILGGPYTSASGWMHDSLRVLNQIPLTEPFSNGPYNVVPIGGVAGETITSGVLAVTGANAIVDWMLVELRNANSPGSIVANRRALLQRDGDIVDLDGVSPLSFPLVNAGLYYVSVKHRNHLGVMTQLPWNLSACNAVTIDFTSANFPVYVNPAISNAPRKVVDNLLALWPGDANRNKNVKYNGFANDKDRVLAAIGVSTPNATLWPVYRIEDLNMDGKIRYNNTDNDRILILNQVGASTPNTILFQHTPD